MPLRRLPERLRKKLTVIGIMGHTQGVTSASRPPRKPRKKMAYHALPDTSLSLCPKDCNSSMTGVHHNAVAAESAFATIKGSSLAAGVAAAAVSTIA